MESSERPQSDTVLTAWAPAGKGRIIVVLGQGVVIHKAVVSLKAGVITAAQTAPMLGGAVGGAIAGVIRGAASSDEIASSPFVQKVLRNGVDGLLASPRKTLVRWDQITAAEYVKGFRRRMIIRTNDGDYTLRFLSNTRTVGDPVAVFEHFLGERFTGPAAR